MLRTTSLLFRLSSVAAFALALACSRREAPPAPAEPAASGSAAPAQAPQAVEAAPTPTQAAQSPVAPILLGRASDAASPIRVVSGSELLTHMKTSGNRATIVNAWASWCGPCRREMPMLIGLTTNLQAQGVELLFVSVDEPDSEQAALAFLRDQGGEPPVYVAERPLPAFMEAMNPRWPGMLPATFLFDAEGKLRYFWGGPVYEHELLPIVDGFLAGKNIDGEARFGLAPGQDSRPQ